MKLGMILVLVCSSAILAACNKGSSDALAISPEKQGVDVPAFQGNWTSGKCDDWGGGGEYRYSGRQFVTIRGSSMESYVKEYNNGTCSGPERSIMRFKMKFDISSDVKDDWYNIDVVATAITQTVYDQDTANLFNTTAYCGFTDWLVNEEKNISDSNCMSGIKTNQTIYSMVKITGDTIQLGEEDKDKIHDGTTPEKRHNTPGAIFKRE